MLLKALLFCYSAVAYIQVASFQPCLLDEDCPMQSKCDIKNSVCKTDIDSILATTTKGEYQKPTDIDECKEQKNPCSSFCGIEGLRCENTIGSYKCLCPNGRESINCKCESSCTESKCPWNRQCYEKGLQEYECGCREMSDVNRAKQDICVKDPSGTSANFFPHPIFFYNSLCQTSDDDCGFPENEADVHKARDFNYFGGCQFDVALVKCEFGVKPVKRGSYVFCDYPPETRSYMTPNCTSKTYR